jgi:hypothetical protein
VLQAHLQSVDFEVLQLIMEHLSEVDVLKVFKLILDII